MIRLGLILMTICLAASLVLAITYKITSPAIEAQKTDQQNQALKNILTDADEFKQMYVDRFNYYEGMKNKNTIGYVLKVKAKGYSGDIDLLVGIDDKGTIKGIEVLSHQETPGLGSRITEIKQGRNRPWFLEQFNGRTAPGLKMSDIHPVRNSHLTSETEISNGVQAISGATISSEAVLEAIKKETEDFLSYMQLDN